MRMAACGFEITMTETQFMCGHCWLETGDVRCQCEPKVEQDEDIKPQQKELDIDTD